MALTISRPSEEDIYLVRGGYLPNGTNVPTWDWPTAVAALVGAAQSGGGGSSTPVTPSIHLYGPGTYSIPSGAKGWTLSVITGTITYGGQGPYGVGFSDSDPNTLAAAITIVVDSASSAHVRWNT